jgi:hypothetical protein
MKRKRRFNPNCLEIGACRLDELPDVMRRAMTSETAPNRMIVINLSDRLRKFYAALDEVQKKKAERRSKR